MHNFTMSCEANDGPEMLKFVSGIGISVIIEAGILSHVMFTIEAGILSHVMFTKSASALCPNTITQTQHSILCLCYGIWTQIYLRFT